MVSVAPSGSGLRWSRTPVKGSLGEVGEGVKEVMLMMCSEVYSTVLGKPCLCELTESSQPLEG